MASPLYATSHHRKNVEKNQPGEKQFKTVGPPGGSPVALGGKKKKNNLPVQCPPHVFHALHTKNKEQSTCAKNKRKNGFSQTPLPLPLQQ